MAERLGLAMIQEMAARRQFGRYFTYRELKDLRRVGDTEDLQRFLQSTRYAGMPICDDPDELIDALQSRPTGWLRGVLWGICDPLLFGLPGIVFAYFFMKRTNNEAREELAELSRHRKV